MRRSLWLLLVACICWSCEHHDGPTPTPAGVSENSERVVTGVFGAGDEEAAAAVDAFVALPTAEHLAAAHSEPWTEARDAVRALGARPLPALAARLDEVGCREPWSRHLVDLLFDLPGATGFEGKKASSVVDLLLRIVAGAEEVATPPSASLDAVLGRGGGARSAAAAVGAGKTPADALAAAQRGASRRCVERALDEIRLLGAMDQVSPHDLERLTRRYLDTLPDGSPRAIPLVELLDASADLELPAAEAFEAMAGDPKWTPLARAAACEASIRRNHALERSLQVVDTLPAAVLLCLLRRARGREWFDTHAAVRLLDHPDPEVRVEALHCLDEEASAADFQLLVARYNSAVATGGHERERAEIVRALSDIYRLNPHTHHWARQAMTDPDLRAAVEADTLDVEGMAPVDRYAREGCDHVLEPSAGAAGIAAALDAGGPGAAVCLRAGTYRGTLTLTGTDGKLLSLTGGGATLSGDLLVVAPSVVVGLDVRGGVVTAPEADGSVLLGVRARARSTLLSERSLYVGFESAGGIVAIDEALTAPTSGPTGELAVHVRPGQLETQGSHGGALGWADAVFFRHPLREEWSAEALDLARVRRGMTDGLALAGPDRAPINPDDRWIPLYGDAAPEDVSSALAVPLRTAPWRLGATDLVVLTE